MNSAQHTQKRIEAEKGRERLKSIVKINEQRCMRESCGKLEK